MSVDLQPEPVRTGPEFVQYEMADRVATIWLNRPEVKNCVNWSRLQQFGEALEQAERDPDVRVVLVRGRGHTFCAGADLKMLDADFLGTTTSRSSPTTPRSGTTTSGGRCSAAPGRSTGCRATSGCAAPRNCC